MRYVSRFSEEAIDINLSIIQQAHNVDPDDVAFHEEKSALKGVARTYLLEFNEKNETNLYPRIQQGFANAHTAIKSLQQHDKNMNDKVY